MTRIKATTLALTLVVPTILTSIVGSPSIFALETPVTPVTSPTTPTPTQPVTPVNPTETPTPTQPVTPPTTTAIPTPSPTPTNTPVPTTTPTPTPQPATSKITVFAAGTKALNKYPTLKLSINNNEVKVWKNVKGNPSAGKFVELKANYKNTLTTGDKVKVEFTNDFAFWGMGDRNVRIDKLEINGQVFQTENPAVFGTGAATQSNSCGAGNLQTEWLYCNGYFEFVL